MGRSPGVLKFRHLPFAVRHKYSEEIRADIVRHGITFETDAAKEKYVEDKTYAYVVQQMQNFVFGLNVPSRWGTQTPFTNITLDWTCPDDLKNTALHLGGYEVGTYAKTYGELDHERKLVNRALLEVYASGDYRGRAFTFPIPTYNITEDFPWEDPDIDALFSVTAKYGLPYFQNFIGSQYRRVKNADGTVSKVPNDEAYKPGAVRSMCCRLQLDLRELLKRGNGLFGSAEMTGSIGVVTLNLARIGYLTKGDEAEFRRRVKHLMDLAKSSLEIKRKVLSGWLERGLYPVHLPVPALVPQPFLHHRTQRNERSHLEFHERKRRHLHERRRTLRARNARLHAEHPERIPGRNGKHVQPRGNAGGRNHLPFRPRRPEAVAGHRTIRNARQSVLHELDAAPVEFTDDAFEALEFQNALQCKYTGGTVLHLYMGERLSDASACKSLVRKAIENYQMPYITVTPTFSVCPKHGYVNGEHDYCPKCDAEIGYA
jgi:anaerobic ribonucleoside-triphosphate reductase